VKVAITRRYVFPAAHVLCRDDLTPAENERLYGKCANPNGHGHNYGVEVTLAGPVDPATGCVVDPAWLDAEVQRRVVDRLAHRLLNDDPAFSDAVPTAENIVRFVESEMLSALADRTDGPRLARVRIRETRRNTFETGDPQ
jgi:6-pyruvoyltetrahydropterin/6-carboxytetrahydropterin synthase